MTLFAPKLNIGHFTGGRLENVGEEKQEKTKCGCQNLFDKKLQQTPPMRNKQNPEED